MSIEREIVLIVDDDPGVSALQRRRLERAGFEVCNADSASVAMEHLRRGGVRLVVLDYRLSSETNGLEFYAAMKRAGYDLPVIMVTGYSQEATVVEALRAGVRDFVAKSSDYVDYLLQAVERLFQQSRVERSLAEAQAHLRAVIESSMDAIITTDSRGTVTLFNPSAERMFGHSAAQAVGQPIARFSAQMAALLREASCDAAPHTGSAPYETYAMRPNGQPFMIETSLSRGEVEGKAFYTFIVRDITQRQQVAAELRLAKEAADAASVAKTAFLTNVSHELRTPMTAILGFTDLLLDEEPSVSLPAALDVIKRNGVYLLEIINDLLDVSKIEAGQLTIEHALCSPAQVLAETHGLMQVRSQAKGLSFMVQCLNPLPQFAYTDAMRLRQILINLVGNAIKFTESGEVRIVASYEPSRQVLSISVVDTGIGMSREQIAGLFRPFTQADSSTTRRFGGTGLGLTISKRLAELLGGDIQVRSEPGVGSTFRLTIPMMAQPTARPAEAARGNPAGYVAETAWRPTMAARDLTEERRSEPDQGRSWPDLPPRPALRRVLLVEDSPDSQRLIVAVLSKSGADVTVVENGQLAIDEILDAKQQGTAYDIILMDMQMPVLDGYEATRRLRRAGQTQPIIALTAHAMNGDREKCFDAGCDDYMTKPIDVATLRGKLAQWGQMRRVAAKPTA
ncbi:MAG TPA: response regulator [Pirellulales bacterium]|nr:response regulator [Pirellulales bacterium]